MRGGKDVRGRMKRGWLDENRDGNRGAFVEFTGGSMPMPPCAKSQWENSESRVKRGGGLRRGGGRHSVWKSLHSCGDIFSRESAL